MPTRRSLALSLLLATVALVAASGLSPAFAKKPPPAPAAPDCSTCTFPAACKELKRCIKSCNTSGAVAFQCLKTRRVNEETYTAATGRPPDDFDSIVDETKVETEAPKPGSALPDQLTMEQIKKGMGAVDFAPCVKEGNVKPGEAGTVMVKLVIEKEGTVSSATCPQNSALTRCVLPRAKTATFPKFGGLPMKMTFPVVVRN